MSFRERILERAKRMRLARERRGTLWVGLGLVGALGWMIVLPAVGGAFAGHWLDARFETERAFTLALMLLGIIVGAYSVWRFFLRELS